MKKLIIIRFGTSVILVVLMVCFAVRDASARGIAQKSHGTPPTQNQLSNTDANTASSTVANTASNTNTQKSSTPFSFIKKKEGITPDKPKKNPVTEFFGSLGKKKSQSTVPLPSEKALSGGKSSPATIPARTKSSPKRIYGKTPPQKDAISENVQDAVIPEATIPETAVSETVISETAVPDIIILENGQTPFPSGFSSIPLEGDLPMDQNGESPYHVPVVDNMSPPTTEPLPPPTSAEKEAMQRALMANADILEDVPTENSEDSSRKETSGGVSGKNLAVTQGDIPAIPSDNVLPGMDPEETVTKNRDGAPVNSDTLEGWNQEIPQLEFMEKKGSTPQIGVSVQRLTSSVFIQSEAENKKSSRVMQVETPTEKKSDWRSELEMIAPTQETTAEVKPQCGAQVSLPTTTPRSDNSLGNKTKKARKAKNSRAELGITTRSPENMLVGLESTFQIEVRNLSDSASEGSLVEIEIPNWFTVHRATVEKGTTVILPNVGSEGQHCIWDLGTLMPETSEVLLLTVTPQESKAADFQISWSNRKEEKTQAVIAEAPKLALDIVTTQSASEGEQLSLTLCVQNTGKCVVRDIALDFSTEGCEKNDHIVPGIKSLLPGEEETVEILVTPKTRNAVKCDAKAFIQSQQYARAEKWFNVQYVDLSIAVPTLSSSFTGMEIPVPIHVENHGNRTAKNVRICVELPEQVRLLRSEPTLECREPSENHLILELNDLVGGKSADYTLLLRIQEAGNFQIPCELQAHSQTLATTNIPLSVEAIANIQMELKVPAQALSTTEMSTYEIVLTNVGTQTVTDGQLLVFFADGIEPMKTTDMMANIFEGGVVMFNVPELRPGDEHTFNVQAQVNANGNYPIRCQLKSDACNLDIIQQKTAIYR